MSRAYYGILHYLCDYIVAIVGFDKSKVKYAIHVFVPQCFNACAKQEAKLIAVQLEKLKQKRTDADYKLGPIVSDSKCSDSIKYAQKIIDSDFENIKKELFAEAEKAAKARGWM